MIVIKNQFRPCHQGPNQFNENHYILIINLNAISRAQINPLKLTNKTATYPVSKAESHQVCGRDAVFEILQENIAMKQVYLFEIAEQLVFFILDIHGYKMPDIFMVHGSNIPLRKHIKQKS